MLDARFLFPLSSLDNLCIGLVSKGEKLKAWFKKYFDFEY